MASFHNTQPRTREERLAAQNKELLERGRLKARPGHGHVSAEPINPLQPDPHSALYEPNVFQRDVAGMITQQKQERLHKQKVRVWQCAPQQQQLQKRRMQLRDVVPGLTPLKCLAVCAAQHCCLLPAQPAPEARRHHTSSRGPDCRCR
jgi:hypothetical protein